MSAITVNQLGGKPSPFATAPGGKMPDFLIPAESSLPIAPPPIPLADNTETRAAVRHTPPETNNDSVVYTAIHCEQNTHGPSKMYVPLDDVTVAPAETSDNPDGTTWNITEVMSSADTANLFPFWNRPNRERKNKWRLPSQIHAVKITNEEENIHTWIPGISTPEGIVLVTGVAAAAGLSLADGVILERVLTAASTVIVTGVTVGLPAATLAMFK